MTDLQYFRDNINRDCQEAENIILKRGDPDLLPGLIEAKLNVLRILDELIKAEK